MGIENLSYMMSMGESITKEYPPDACIRMSNKSKAMQLGGLVGNTHSLMIVHRLIKDLILEHDQRHDVLEFLPLQIYNHKNRIASADYFIINPLGADSCLDLKKSVIKRDEDGSVISVKKMVLSKKLIDKKKAVFCPSEDSQNYIVREDWVKKVKGLGLAEPNILGVALEISD